MAGQVVADHSLAVSELKVLYRDTVQKIAQPLPEIVAGLGRDILRHEYCIVTQEGKVSIDVASLNRRNLLLGHREHLLAVTIQTSIHDLRNPRSSEPNIQSVASYADTPAKAARPKTRSATRGEALKELEQGLRLLQTDRMNCLHIHNVARDDRYPDLDQAPSSQGVLGGLIEARRRGIGVIAMKVLGGPAQNSPAPRLATAEDYQATLRYVWGVAGVSVAIMGRGDNDELRQGLAAARAYRAGGPRQTEARPSGAATKPDRRASVGCA